MASLNSNHHLEDSYLLFDFAVSTATTTQTTEGWSTPKYSLFGFSIKSHQWTKTIWFSVRCLCTVAGWSYEIIDISGNRETYQNTTSILVIKDNRQMPAPQKVMEHHMCGKFSENTGYKPPGPSRPSEPPEPPRATSFRATKFVVCLV